MRSRCHTRLVVVSAIVVFGLGLSYGVHAQDAPDVMQPPASPLATPTALPALSVVDAAINSIAQQEGIPSGELAVVSRAPVHFRMLGLEYEEVVVERTRPDAWHQFWVLVDPKTGMVTSDFAAVRKAEEEAHLAKYGKIEPHLFDRLQAVQDTDLFKIAIWVADGEFARQPEDLYTEVAQHFPEARQALNERRVPWAVDDPALEAAIFGAYSSLLNASVAQRTEPLVKWLTEQGIEAKRSVGIPIFQSVMTKAQILKAAANPLVGRIFADDNIESPASDTAVATSRIPQLWLPSPLWPQGLNGAFVDVAVVEPGRDAAGNPSHTNINAVARGCLNIARGNNVTAIWDDRANDGEPHQSIVAAIVACRDPDLPGVASGVRIFDGWYDSTAGATLQQVLAWAVDARDAADVINLSMEARPPGNPNSTALLQQDFVVDNFARYYRKLIVVSAGNVAGGAVASPGKGWNVLTVGNYDNRNTAAWASGPTGAETDAMRPSSSHRNPDTLAEKPNVVAPGTDINTVAGANTGTSFAAPQVSGLAALLIQASGYSLRFEPEVLRAILAASAVHNLDGPRDIPQGQDLRDGAGGVNGRLAAAAASLNGTGITCNRSCWWAVPSFNPLPNDPQPHLARTFYATQRERVRVAIAWVSDANAAYTSDVLRHNLMLNVIGPSGFSISSNSSSISEELVDFVAPRTGTYTIRVNRSASDTFSASQYTYLGIAFVKDATYLPDVRGSGNPSGYTSLITIRNDGALDRPVAVNWLNADGTFHSSTVYTLRPNANWSLTAPNGFWSSAVVDGAEDLSVAVLHDARSPYRIGTYTGVSLPSTEAHVPIIQRNNSGWWSDLFIQNAGGVQNNVQVTFYARIGTSCHISAHPLNAGASWRIKTADPNSTCPTGTFVGSARVVSANGVPLTVSSTQTNTVSLMVTDNAAGSAGRVYAALVQNNNPPGCIGNCWKAGLQVQNAWSGTSTLRFELRESAGPASCNRTFIADAWSPWVVYPLLCTPPTPTASADFWSDTSSTAFVTANINQIRENSASASTYPAIAGYSRVVTVPRVWRVSPWNDALAIRNLSSSTQRVTVYFYNATGTQLPVISEQNVAANAIWGLFPPDPATGSAVVTAAGPLAVQVNNWNSTQSGDNIGSYTPTHR